jgi:uncharacterized membrane protein (Fun14 family)
VRQAWRGRRSLAGIALAAGLTLIPYWIAAGQAPGDTVFSGFLLNPTDGFSYLAKMRQGWDGQWLFRLSYTDAPGSPTLLFAYHLLLGHLARALDLPLIAAYHAARGINTVLMFLAAREFFRRSSLSPEAQTGAFALVLFGSGWGWLAAGAGFVAADLEMPEVIPWVSGYANAHFPLASACLLASAALFLRPPASRWAGFLMSLGCGFILGAVAGYAALPLGAAMVAWVVWFGRKAGAEGQRPRLSILAGFLIGSVPWLAYAFWLTVTHPVLSSWFDQNLTPSPAPFSYLLAYGPLLLLVAAGSWRRGTDRTPAPTFLVIWAILMAASLYAPFSLQRRLSLGLFFALAGIAGWAIERWARRRLAAVAAIVSGLPSLGLVVLAGLAAVRVGQTGTVIPVPSLEAMEWLDEHAEEAAVVLAGPQTGNMLPAYAGVRVVYGHPFETPDAEEQRILVVDLLSGQIEAARAMEIARDRNLSYLFYGPEEQSLGAPTWLSSLDAVFSNSLVRIYRFPAP